MSVHESQARPSLAVQRGLIFNQIGRGTGLVGDQSTGWLNGAYRSECTHRLILVVSIGSEWWSLIAFNSRRIVHTLPLNPAHSSLVVQEAFEIMCGRRSDLVVNNTENNMASCVRLGAENNHFCGAPPAVMARAFSRVVTTRAFQNHVYARSFHGRCEGVADRADAMRRRSRLRSRLVAYV